MNLGGGIHKYLLHLDGEFILSVLRDYVEKYIDVPTREAQDDAMLFKAIINSFSSDGKFEIYNRSGDFHTLGEELGVFLIKTIIDEPGFQTYTMVIEVKVLLVKLPKLMVCLTHNVRKFNSKAITTTHNLRRNGSSVPDLLHQLFPPYLVCPYKEFYDYAVDKQNNFEEGMIMKTDYLMKCARYNYNTILDNGE